jgi:hypothetical protein
MEVLRATGSGLVDMTEAACDGDPSLANGLPEKDAAARERGRRSKLTLG